MSAAMRAKLLEEIWPCIEEANRECPAYAKISKSHILFTKPEKPMHRTPKGTIRRRETLEAYAVEIDNLYRDAEFVSTTNKHTRGADLDNSSTLTQVVQECISTVTGKASTADRNFFENGMDSLEALLLVRELRGTLDAEHLSISTIYAYPSVDLLVRAIRQLHQSQQEAVKTEEHNRKAGMVDMLEQYCSIVDEISPAVKNPPNIHHGKQVVILTGSTGAFGSYLLNALLRKPSVAYIYCLNRSSDAICTHRKRSKQLGWIDGADLVRFLQVDLAQMQFGLDSEYDEMLQTVTTIIHNAWPVNFNLNLASFTPQLEGLVELIRFTALAPLGPELMFVSSVGAVQSLSRIVPEQIITDYSASGHTGYSESKYVSERLLAHASDKLGIGTCIVRVGQIAGPAEGPGTWNAREWLPSLLISSAHLGAVPASLPVNLDVIDWLPIDKLAQVFVDLAVSSDGLHHMTNANNTARTVHLRNPHVVRWEALVPEVTKSIAASSQTVNPEAVSFEVWLRRVRDDLETATQIASESGESETLAEAVERNPAAKLLGFFEEQTKASDRCELETKTALQMNSGLGSIGPVQAKWMAQWTRRCLSNID